MRISLTPLSGVSEVMAGVLLGNVAAAIVFADAPGASPGGDPRARLSEGANLLSGLFGDVLIISDPAAEAPGHPIAFDAASASLLDAVVMALENAEAERVMVIPLALLPSGHDLLVGLAAWPEHDVVTVKEAAALPGGCSIYRREATLSVARDLQGGASGSLEALHEALDAVLVSVAQLAGEDLLDSVRVDSQWEAC